MELKYNICFTLGDYSYDGHHMYETYHITCNYSSDEISAAFQGLSKELKWNFLDECKDYEDNQLTEEGELRLLKLGIISESDLNISKNMFHSTTYTIISSDEFVNIFFKLVKIKISDLVWDHRNLKEEYLTLLDGAAYGLFRD